MHGRVVLAAYQPDRLVSLFRVFIAKRRQNHVIFSLENLDSELQSQSVLEAICLVLGRVELELHASTLCETHIACKVCCVHSGPDLTIPKPPQSSAAPFP